MNCRMLASHVDGNPNLVSCVGSGTGGPSEMAQSISDSDVMYALGKYSIQFFIGHCEFLSLYRLLNEFSVLYGDLFLWVTPPPPKPCPDREGGSKNNKLS